MRIAEDAAMFTNVRFEKARESERQQIASLNLLPHVTSYGELPVVVYQQSECGRHHGNFIAASYRAILGRPEWRKPLQKVHSQGRRSLPARDGALRGLGSSFSSYAMLTNIFCCPGV